jgi:hypothetical protein
MGTVIVAIVVGSLSGVLGSVLGPIVTSWLRNREHEQERKREIHRELRQMIEDRIGDCGSAAAALFRIDAHMKIGLSPFDAYNRSFGERWEKLKDQPRHRWEPYRIKDETLKGLAEELHNCLLEFDSHLLSVTRISRDEWWAAMSDRERGLREIERQVRLRLDELRW